MPDERFPNTCDRVECRIYGTDDTDAEVEFTYDAEGNFIHTRDGMGNGADMEYDLGGRP